MAVVIGGPKKPEKDERPAFYIHDGLHCYLDTQPNGVYVEGKDPKGSLLFRVHNGNVSEAMQYIEHLREELGDDAASEGSKDA